MTSHSITRALATCITTVLLSGSAYSATVSSLSGTVLYSSASGYVEASSPTALKPGDTVIVNPGGFGQISYDDGCVVKVSPGEVAVISDISPCKSGIQTGSINPPDPPPAGGIGGAAPYIIGAAVIGGGIALASSGGGSSDSGGGGAGGGGPPPLTP